MKLYRVRIADHGVDQIQVAGADIDIPVDRATYRIWQRRTSAINCAGYWSNVGKDWTPGGRVGEGRYQVDIDVANVVDWIPFDLEVDKMHDKIAALRLAGEKEQLKSIIKAAMKGRPFAMDED